MKARISHDKYLKSMIPHFHIGHGRMLATRLLKISRRKQIPSERRGNIFECLVDAKLREKFQNHSAGK